MTKEELINLLPPWFQNIREFPEIMKAYAHEFTIAETNMGRVRNNMFLQTCDEDTLADWERIMKIYPEPGEDLEIRRKRVISRWSMQGNYGGSYIQEQLNQLLGEGNFDFRLVVATVGFTTKCFGYIEYYVPVPSGRDLAVALWTDVAPAHIWLTQVDDFDVVINSNLYVGGICQQTTRITI